MAIATTRSRRRRRAGTTKTIQLDSGGTVTVSTTADLLAIGGEDRALVLALVDRLREYERRAEPTRDDRIERRIERLAGE